MNKQKRDFEKTGKHSEKKLAQLHKYSECSNSKNNQVVHNKDNNESAFVLNCSAHTMIYKGHEEYIQKCFTISLSISRPLNHFVKFLMNIISNWILSCKKCNDEYDNDYK